MRDPDFKPTKRWAIHVACLAGLGLACHFVTVRMLGTTWTQFGVMIAVDVLVLQMYRAVWGNSVIPPMPINQQVRTLAFGIGSVAPMVLLALYSPWGRTGTYVAMTIYGVVLFAVMGFIIWRWRDELEAWLRG